MFWSIFLQTLALIFAIIIGGLIIARLFGSHKGDN